MVCDIALAFFIGYGVVTWSSGWESPYHRVLDSQGLVVIGVLGLVLELRFVVLSGKKLTVWWLFIPIRIVPTHKITSITLVRKANNKRDDSVRVLITVAPCMYHTDMALTAAAFARQHLIKGIFFRIPKKNPEETIRKLKAFRPDLEIPFVTQP